MFVLEREVVALRGDRAGCAVAPGAGGAVAGFWWESGHRRIDWLRPASAAALACGDGGEMACFPLLPWIDRIRDGRFRFGDDEVSDDAGDGHGRSRPWHVVAQDAARMVLEYVHAPGRWPWSYRARQEIAVVDAALALTLEIENLSDRTMPVGLGFHPVFPRPHAAVLGARTGGVWHAGGDTVPRASCAAPSAAALATGRRIADLETDTVFEGWDGRAVIAWPERDARLVIEGEWPILSFLAIRATAGRDSFALEPASQCADAVNLARAGVADTGVRVLAPGARRSARMVLRPELG